MRYNDFIRYGEDMVGIDSGPDYVSKALDRNQPSPFIQMLRTMQQRHNEEIERDLLFDVERTVISLDGSVIYPYSASFSVSGPGLDI